MHVGRIVGVSNERKKNYRKQYNLIITLIPNKVQFWDIFNKEHKCILIASLLLL